MVGMEDRRQLVSEQVRELNRMIDNEVDPVYVKSYRGTVLTAAHEAGIELEQAKDGSLNFKETHEIPGPADSPLKQ